jgi:hypothetical protein
MVDGIGVVTISIIPFTKKAPHWGAFANDIS